MGRGGNNSRPFYFLCGCDLTAECLLATEEVRVQLPATAPISLGRAPACATESPKLSLLGAAPRRPANRKSKFKIFLGPWQKSDAPALQAALSGSVTRRTPPFHRGELD